MRVDRFDFDLPAERIALRPARPRDAARLLIARGRGAKPPALEDRQVRDLPELLVSGDVLVFNDTKVIPAQLRALRGPREGQRGGGDLGSAVQIGGPKVDLTLIERLGPNVWRAFARPAKRLRPGDRLTLEGDLGADVIEKEEGGAVVLAFAEEGPALDAAVARLGAMPLPPYIASKRAADDQDREDYQTLFAAREGAVAAPTAGLHFTPELLERLAAQGVGHETLTLHVGAGTFLPVKAETTEEHVMHSEWGEVDGALAARLQEARAAGGRIIAVGTTVLRLLETAARETGTIRPFAGNTDIFITPGYRFRAVDCLLTNFHLPRSTLFMLVSAFLGLEAMQAVYGHAIGEGYRFYSYGDASLLIPGDAV